MAEAIRISGLREFVRNLRKLDADLPKTLRVAFNGCADVVVADARPRVPSRSGRAARSVRARSTRTAVRVVGGGNKAPYYPWLDFGGRVGRGRSVERKFLKDGRFLYDAFFRKRKTFEAVMVDALVDAARAAGIEVD